MSTSTNTLAQKIAMIEFHSSDGNSSLSSQLDSNLSISKKGQINAGALLAFGKNTSAQDKQDVQNSILFAQLAANTAHDRFVSPLDWQKKFCDVLSLIGWSQLSFEDSSQKTQAPVDWNKQVLNFLSASASSEVLETMHDTLSRAEKLTKNSKAIQIWEKQSCGPNNTRLMNGALSVTTNNDLMINITTTYFNLSRQTQGYQNWETVADASSTTFQSELNADIYKAIRKQIEEKLAGRIHQYVACV